MEHSPKVGTVPMQQSVEPRSQTLSPPVQEPSSSVAQFSISPNPLTTETISIDSVAKSSVSPDLPPHKDFDTSFSLFEKIVGAYCDKSNLTLLWDRYNDRCLPITYDPEEFSESYGDYGEYWWPRSEENARKVLLDLNPGAGYTFMSPEARIKGRSLCLAIVMRDIGLVKTLLDDGAIVDFRDQIDALSDGNTTFQATPLVLAALIDSLPILKLLLGAGAEVNQTDPLRGRTVLHSAAFFANENIIRALLEAGADREIRDVKGWKALHCATYGVRPDRAGFQVANLRAMELLIEGKADLESRTRDGLTPLHISVYTYQQDATIWLLKRGASVHAKTGDGKTALDFLYVRSHKAKTGIDENTIALALLYYGGFSRGKFGDTRLHGAVRLQKQVYVALLLSQEAETLFQPPPSQHVNTRNDFGRTPLHYAALNANQAIIECLLNNGANTEIKDRKGNTAIHYAAAYPERVGCLQELVLAGADVNSKGASGVTALHLAAQWEIDKVAVPLEDINVWGPDERVFNVLVVLGFLLKAGAVVDARTDSGATALSLAAATDNDERMELLLNASAPPSRRRAVLADALLFAKRQKRLNKARLVEDFGPELGFAGELVSSWMMNRIVYLVMPAAFILCLVIWWLMA
jgi:ankyrin repeat protein